MHRHEGIFWDIGSETDEIRVQLKAIQDKLDNATASCFQEPVSTIKILIKKMVLMTNKSFQRTAKSCAFCRPLNSNVRPHLTRRKHERNGYSPIRSEERRVGKEC